MKKILTEIVQKNVFMFDAAEGFDKSLLLSNIKNANTIKQAFKLFDE